MGDTGCQQDCLNQGSLESQGLILDVARCFQSANCPEGDTACQNQACADEVNACVSDSAPAPENLSCAGVFTCFGDCPAGDRACIEACEQAVSPDQSDVFQNFSNCLNTNMCQDQACAETNCATEFDACYPVGDATCGEGLACILACTRGDSYCSLECQLSMSEVAREEIEALITCVEMNRAQCQTVDCPACADEYSACND